MAHAHVEEEEEEGNALEPKLNIFELLSQLIDKLRKFAHQAQ